MVGSFIFVVHKPRNKWLLGGRERFAWINSGWGPNALLAITLLLLIIIAPVLPCCFGKITSEEVFGCPTLGHKASHQDEFVAKSPCLMGVGRSIRIRLPWLQIPCFGPSHFGLQGDGWWDHRETYVPTLEPVHSGPQGWIRASCECSCSRNVQRLSSFLPLS